MKHIKLPFNNPIIKLPKRHMINTSYNIKFPRVDFTAFYIKSRIIPNKTDKHLSFNTNIDSEYQHHNISKIHLTEEDCANLSTIYNYSKNHDMIHKYGLQPQLNYEEKKEIKTTISASKRPKSKSPFKITQPKPELYTSPYKSKSILKLNSMVLKKIQGVRMKNVYNTYIKKINEIKESKNASLQMPIVRITKRIAPIGRASKRKLYSITKTDEKNPKGINMLSQEQLLNEVKITFDEVQTMFHPSARKQFAFSLTEEGNIIIFGGILSKKLNDMYICNLNTNKETLTWEKIYFSEENAPIPRYGHSMIHYKNQLFIYGGNIEKIWYKPRENNVVIYSIKSNTFYYPKCSNAKNVQFRHNHIGIAVGYTMVIQGGIDEYGNYLNDIWLFNCIKYKWSPLIFKAKFPIPKLAYHSCCLVIKNKEHNINDNLSIYKIPEVPGERSKGSKTKIEGIYIFGGIDKEGYYSNNLWVIRIGSKPVDVVQLKTSGKGPCGRMSCGICFFQELNFLVVHGGKNNFVNENNIFNDVMILELETFNWITPVYNKETFLHFCEHAIFTYGNEIYILGGVNNEGFAKFEFYNIDFDYFNNLYI